MQQGKSGMSNRKHSKSGWKNGSGKSPKLRHHLVLEAKKNDRKAKPALPYSSVNEAFRNLR